MKVQTFTNTGGEKVDIDSSTGNDTPNSMKGKAPEKAHYDTSAPYAVDPGGYGKNASAKGIRPACWNKNSGSAVFKGKK